MPRVVPGAVLFSLSILVVTLALVVPHVGLAQAQPQPDCNPPITNGNLVGDCGFEQPPVVSGITLPANIGFPNASTGPWFAGSAGADITRVQWQPNSGLQSGDINGKIETSETG